MVKYYDVIVVCDMKATEQGFGFLFAYLSVRRSHVFKLVPLLYLSLCESSC